MTVLLDHGGASVYSLVCSFGDLWQEAAKMVNDESPKKPNTKTEIKTSILNHTENKIMKEIKELLAITKKLRDQYQYLGKQFTLDGKLVGDIGEVLAAEKYGLVLYSDNTPNYDGYEKSTGKQVQIKASFKEYCYFPAKHVPDYFLAIHILESGEIKELYNGTGHFLKEHYIDKRKLKGYQGLYYILSKGQLKELNARADNLDKIQEVLIAQN